MKEFDEGVSGLRPVRKARMKIKMKKEATKKR